MIGNQLEMSIVRQFLEAVPLADITTHEFYPLTDSDFSYLLKNIPLLLQKIFYGVQRHLVHPVNVMLLLLHECTKHRVELLEEVLVSWKGEEVISITSRNTSGAAEASSAFLQPEEEKEKKDNLFRSSISCLLHRNDDEEECAPPGIRLMSEMTRQLLLSTTSATASTTTPIVSKGSLNSVPDFCLSSPATSRCNPFLLLLSLRTLCQRPRLKNLFGTVLPISLLEYLEHVEDLHLLDMHEVSRSCAHILIDLLSGSYVNKNRISLLVGKRGFGASCFVRSGDIFLQMQWVEILFRLHLHNPSVFLSQVASSSSSSKFPLPPFMKDSIARLQNNEQLLDEIVNLLNVFHKEYVREQNDKDHGNRQSVKAASHHASLIRQVDVVNLAVERGEAEVCGHASMYFSRHLLVFFLPRSSLRVHANAETDKKNESTEVSTAGGLHPSEKTLLLQPTRKGITHFTIPYEHIRSVKVSRDRRLSIRLSVIPEKLLPLMSLDSEGGDVLRAHLTDATLTFLRASGIHQWIMERKKSSPVHVPLPVCVAASTTTTSHPVCTTMTDEECFLTVTAARSPTSTQDVPLPSFSTTCILPSSPVDGAEYFFPSSSAALPAVSRDGSSIEDPQRRPREENDIQDTSTLPPPSSSMAFLAEQAGEQKAIRFRHDRSTHLQRTRDTVSAEVEALHQFLSKEREQLREYMEELWRNIAEAEETMKQSAAASIRTLNEELESVQELGNMLVKEADTVKKEITKTMGRVEGVETSVLRRVNETVEGDLKHLRSTLSKFMNEAGPYHVIKETQKKENV